MNANQLATAICIGTIGIMMMCGAVGCLMVWAVNRVADRVAEGLGGIRDDLAIFAGVMRNKP